jgi:hypothetical protein
MQRLGRGAKVVYGGVGPMRNTGRKRQNQVKLQRPLNKSLEEAAMNQKKIKDQLGGIVFHSINSTNLTWSIAMNSESRAMHDVPMSVDTWADDDEDRDGADMFIDLGPAPGEEGQFHSHFGTHSNPDQG